MPIQILSIPQPEARQEFDHPLVAGISFDYVIPASNSTFLMYWDGVYAGTFDHIIFWVKSDGNVLIRELIDNKYSTLGETADGWLPAAGHLRIDFELAGTVVTVNGGEKSVTFPAIQFRDFLRGSHVASVVGAVTNLGIWDLSVPDVVPGGGDLYRWSQKLHWIQRFIVDLDSVCMFNVCEEQTVWDVCADENWFDVCEENCT